MPMKLPNNRYLLPSLSIKSIATIEPGSCLSNCSLIKHIEQSHMYKVPKQS